MLHKRIFLLIQLTSLFSSLSFLEASVVGNIDSMGLPRDFMGLPRDF